MLVLLNHWHNEQRQALVLGASGRSSIAQMESFLKEEDEHRMSRVCNRVTIF